MKLYLIREFATTEIHGIFWGRTPVDLWDAVDEMADPSRYEWTEITSVGGVWRDDAKDPAVAFPIRGDFPDSTEGDETFDEAWDRAMDFGFRKFSTNLSRMIGHQEEFVCTRFDFTDEGVGLTAWEWARTDAGR